MRNFRARVDEVNDSERQAAETERAAKKKKIIIVIISMVIVAGSLVTLWFAFRHHFSSPQGKTEIDNGGMGQACINFCR